MTVYYNGSYMPEAEARIPVNDRGFLFGDGVYEVFRLIRGRLFEADAHLRRLADGLAALRITPPLNNDRLVEIIGRLVQENGLDSGEATAYLQITRGAAARTHEFPQQPVAPTVYISVSTFIPNEKLRDSGGSAITLPDLRWARCSLKTVNLLPNVLAKQQAVDAGVSTALLVRDGVFTEAPSANVFFVQHGALRTFPASHYILDGITRQVVLDIARNLSIPVDPRPLPVESLRQVDEVFATGTTTDVLPITRIDGLPVGDGKPGLISRKLLQHLRERMDQA